MLNQILALDSWINQVLINIHTPALTKIMTFITNIASFEILFILSLILLFVLIKKKKNVLLFISSMILGLISYLSLKYLIHRIRPENSLIEVSGYSLPSGHATMITIFFLVIIYTFKDEIKNNLLKYLFIGLNILLILLIGFSRLYLAVHWFTDVITGFLLGSVITIVLIKLKNKKILNLSFLLLNLLILIIFISGCAQETTQYISKESKIPASAIKQSPQTDVSPPKLLSADYKQPIPVPGKLNSAGAEDSPFILPDGNTLYFFFTPDVSVPVEKQILDGVTGIWVSKKINNEWQEPERVMLQDKGKLALDGCEFVQDNKILFCTVREGYTGIHWATAELKNNKWTNWKISDFNSEYKVGELHMTKDGNEIYFHSDRAGGKGGLDIWVTKKVNGEWQEPENVAEVNTASNEGWPALNPDENELWITKDYGIWRSKKINNKWTEPEQIVSTLAGEASIDNQGNVYFVHHYYKDNKMIEADIYVAEKN